MARTDSLSNFLTDVANAIREKKSTSDKIIASNFDIEIKSIESGGGISKGIVYNQMNNDGYPTEVTLNGLNKVPNGFFRNVNSSNGQFKNTTKITINGDIESVDNASFRECGVLTQLIFNSNIIPVLSSTNAFTLTPIEDGVGYIYVKDDLIEEYKSATNWSTFANQIKGINEL